VAKKRRAPGGGRKPEYGDRAAPFSLRLPADMRAVLEARQERRDGKKDSLGEVILSVIQYALDSEQEEERRDSPAGALCDLLAATIAGVSSVTGLDWRSDPYAFEAIRLAFNFHLDDWKPPGEIRPRPMKQAEQYKGDWARPSMLSLQTISGNPQELARFVHDVIWMHLRDEPTFPEEETFKPTGKQAIFKYNTARIGRHLILREKEPNQ
jgi:hypothetical protein